MKNRNHVLGQTEALPATRAHGIHMPLVEMYGCRRVLVEWHQGVISYDTQQIHVKSCLGVLCISGEGLQLCRMCREQLVITGKISDISIKRSN